MEAIATDIQARVTDATIAGLGITTARIFSRKLATDRNLAYATATPALIVVSYPAGGTVSLEQRMSTNEKEAVGFPVQVSGFYAADQNLEIDSSSDTFELWAEKVFRRYHGKLPISVTGLYECRVEPGVVIDAEHYAKNNVMVWAHVVRCCGKFARI